MRLKKLEISGFKSFAQKTAMEFPVAISAVVGPNGSGKSNVVDSVRWVLGEQGLKNLRSKSGVDLIWAGSSARAQQSKASVNLYFDNSDGFFPVDFDEVVIGRKIYRDGNNEYYLNNSQVRLKDVMELLARSKLGLRGHSIVNQGSADELLRAGAGERRDILEEALGLREFQLKKSEAEAKLAETSANLEQTEGLINEIAPHLKSLKRQVEKFQRKKSLTQELNDLENNFFNIKIKEIFNERDKNRKEKEEMAARLLAAKENFDNSEKVFEEQMAKVSQTGQKSEAIESDLETLNARRHDIAKEIGRMEGIIESAKINDAESIKTLEKVLAIKIKYWAKRLNAALAANGESAVKSEVGNIANELNVISGHFEKNEISKILSLVDLGDAESKWQGVYEKDKNALKKSLAEVENRIERAKEAITEVRSEESRWREEYSAFQKDMELARREYIALQEAMQKFELAEEKIKLREDDVKSEIWNSGKNYEDLCKTAFAFFSSSSFSGGEILNIAEMENKIVKLRKEAAEIGNIDEEIIRECEETGKRYEFLTAESADLNCAADSLRNLESELAEKIDGDFKTGFVKISEEFNRYFALMFDGGSAKLTLEAAAMGENNNNGAGVAINVSVPRKRVRDLNLLSGGERSLVAIALLFAIVTVSKPPFLILDEIDAALDENNAVRFAKVLNDLAEKTQFILITHNRATMETANVLYGVTMGDDGVSKLFSLKLDDAVL